MGGGASDERQKRVIPRLEPILYHQRHGMASLPIPDELLWDIFLRLPTPADLARASAACFSFRRVAADLAFLRRYRKLHHPPLLGFLEYTRKVFHPAEPPHLSAPEASAGALAADFSFSFLPAPAHDWVVQDIRGGRVLLDRGPQLGIRNRHAGVFPELVVCDPIHRQYLLLPPIRDKLAASVKKKNPYCETFLTPLAGDDEEALAAEETSFGVIWLAHSMTKLVAFVFSSRTGQWRAFSSMSWSDLFVGLPPLRGRPFFSSRQYAYGHFYWLTDWRERMLVLDMKRMEFSVAEPPSEARGLIHVDIAIVEAGEGRPGMFVLGDDRSCLKYTIRRNNGGSSSQWQSEKIISLDSEYTVMCSAGRHLFLYTSGSPSIDRRFHAGRQDTTA